MSRPRPASLPRPPRSTDPKVNRTRKAAPAEGFRLGLPNAGPRSSPLAKAIRFHACRLPAACFATLRARHPPSSYTRARGAKGPAWERHEPVTVSHFARKRHGVALPAIRDTGARDWAALAVRLDESLTDLAALAEDLELGRRCPRSSTGSTRRGAVRPPGGAPTAGRCRQSGPPTRKRRPRPRLPRG